MPYVNIYEAPIYFQVNRLTNIWTEKTSESDITKDNRQVIKDIYEYLLDYEDADRYMPKHLNMNKINKYLMNTRTKYEGLQARYFVYTRIEKPIDISSYKAMEKFYYEGRSVKLEDMNVVLGNEEYSIENLVNTLMKDEQQENEIVLTTNSGNALKVETIIDCENLDVSALSELTEDLVDVNSLESSFYNAKDTKIDDLKKEIEEDGFTCK